MRTVRWIVVGAAMAVCLAAVAASASAKTITVTPGHSIQAAVDAANRGDTIAVRPGVYHGGVAIKKNKLTLRGAGDSRRGTVIKPGSDRYCHGTSGICIGRTSNGRPATVARTRVKGFRIQGFRDFGAVAFGAQQDHLPQQHLHSRRRVRGRGLLVEEDEVLRQRRDQGRGGRLLRRRLASRQRSAPGQRGAEQQGVRVLPA